MRGAPKRSAAWLPPLLVAVALTVAAWAWLGRPVDLPPAPEPKLHCASYTPFRGTQTPFDRSLTIPKAQIEQDLKQLQPVTNCIRTYAVDQGLDQAVPVAHDLGMQVLLGIWIGRDVEANERQIRTAIDLARTYPQTIKAIIVGNEVLLRGEQTGETLAKLATRVRSESGLPVTYADVWEYWLRAPQELKDAVDFITIHILPYWEDDPLPVGEGVQHLQEIVEHVQSKFPGREIMVGETGWPSAGRWREDAAPSIVNQARYLREFLVYAKQHELDYNFIEAFDQPWKRWLEGTAGGFWGLFHEDRTPKFSWDEPVSEHPDWPLLAGISAALGLGILALTRFWRHAASPLPRLLASLGAMLAGTALVLHVEHGWLAARNDWEWLLESGIGLLALASAVLLIGVALAGRLCEAGGSLLEALVWLRRPSGLPDIRQSIALLRLAALLGAATVSLGLCFDSRYRDFPIEAYLVPTLFFFAVDLARRGIVSAQADRREEAGLGLLLAGMAVFVFVNETPLNLESDAWCVLTLLQALPGIGAWRGLWVQRRMMRRSAASRPTAASPAL
jgi:exo-beta-1,3-glucanase (GH17 family)